MKTKPTRLHYLVLVLDAILLAAAPAVAQVSVPPNTYIPPACQGKAITVVSRADYLAQTPTETRSNPPITRTDQLKVFDALTRAIAENYVYPDFNGVNWPGIVAETRAKVAGGLDTETFYKTVQDLVSRLGDEHSYFESPAVRAADNISRAGQDKVVGIGALIKQMPEKKHVSILAVFPDSAAAHAGLKEHDSILAVDGMPLVENGVTYQLRTRGPECSAAVLTIQSPGQAPRAVTVVRYQVAAPAPVYARLVTTGDGARLGYIFLPSFFDATIPGRVKQSLSDFGRLDGLIIDNRMNTGGTSSVLYAVLGLFTSGTVGHFVSRAGSRPLEITADPVGNSRKVPVVILVGPDTVSFGEVFSGVMQDLRRAKLVGAATAGHVEVLHGYTFGDGARAWIAQETFEPINSRTSWRKSGVKPDVLVTADWDTFIFADDPAVKAAVKLFGPR